MYQVITMYGDNEPWWFLMIGKRTLFKKTFDNLTDAETYYVEVWQNFLRIIHTSTQSLII